MENGSGNVSDISGVGGFSQVFTGSDTIIGSSTTSIPNGVIGDFITLSAHCDSGSADFYFRFHRLDDASGAANAYQVPNNYEFHITKILAINPGIATPFKFQLGTATASFTDSNGTDPTGAKWQSGYASRYILGIPTPSSSTVSIGAWELPTMFDENLFPFMQCTGGGGIVVSVVGKLKAKP